MVPNGSATWSNLQIPNTKGLTLKGGQGGTTTIAGANALVINQNSSKRSRVTGFTFTGVGDSNNGDVSCVGTTTTQICRVDHNVFTNAGLAVFIATSGNAPVLIDNNTLTGGAASEMIHNNALGDPSTVGWTTDVTPGSASMVYIENNTFTDSDTSAICSAVESVFGSRTVFRHNSLFFCQVDQHGTPGIVGARWWEIYENTFNAGGLNYCCYADLRGGSGVFFNNHVTGNPPMFPPATVTLREEDTGYPALYQIGRGYNQAYSPVYLWGNDPTMSIVSGSSNVQLNRDYFVSVAQPSTMLRCQSAADGGSSGGSTCPTSYFYVPYTYPYPWQNTTVCASGNFPACDYTTINAAELAASCGDTIVIMAGLGDGTGVNGTPLGWYCGGNGTCNSNNPVLLTHGCTTNTRITLTTDQVSRLPATGARITPAYGDGSSPVVATIYQPGSGMVLYAKTGNGGTPGNNYNLNGLQFCCYSNTTDFLALGSEGQGTNDTTLNVTADIPNNFTLSHVLIRADPTKNMRKGLTWDALNTLLVDSWVDAGFDQGSTDSQGVSGVMGTGSILNTRVTGTGETTSTGGAAPPVFAPIGLKNADNTIQANGLNTVSSIQIPAMEVGFSDITKNLWFYATRWAANTTYPKGTLISQLTGSSVAMQIQGVCTTGGTEPTWPTFGGSVVSGTCTLNRIDSVDCVGCFPNIKNGSECKTASSTNIHHNYYHQIWQNGQQGYVFTFTSSQDHKALQGCNNVTIANNYLNYAALVFNSSAMDVSNDNNAIPGVLTNAGPWTFTGSNNKLSFNFNMNGTVIVTNVTLTTGVGRTAAQVAADLNSAFTGGPGFACIDGLGEVIIRGRFTGDSSTCTFVSTSYRPPLYTVTMNAFANSAYTTLGVNSLVGTTLYGCLNPRGNAWYGCGAVNNVAFLNNLATNINTAKYFTQVNYTLLLGQHLSNIQYLHNTFNTNYGLSNPSGVNLFVGFTTDGTIGNFFPPFSYQIRDTVFAAQSGGISQYYGANGQVLDFSYINWFMGQPSFVNTPTGTPTDQPAAAGTFSHNVIPGASLYTATTRNTTPFTGDSGFNSYPKDNYNTPTAGLALNGTTFKLGAVPGPATDYKDPGVDPTTIPRILNVSTMASDKYAIIRYQITEPMVTSPYFSEAYLTTKDSYFYNAQKVYDNTNYSPVVPDMDPSQSSQPDYDGNDKFPQNGFSRTIIVGLNQPLTPLTTYYLRLFGPGAAWPEDGTSATITTRQSLTGTNGVTWTRNPGTSVGTIATMKVTYGTSYSRTSGVISGGSTASVACTVGTTCTVAVNALASGVPLYYQVQYLSSAPTVLLSEAVDVLLP